MPAQPRPHSKASRDALRHAMLAAGCTTAEIVAELRAQSSLRAREAWRHAHGWTLQQVADHLDDRARGPEGAGADASLISKWEKWPIGGRRPTLTVLSRLADLYGTSASQLIDFSDRQHLPDDDLRIIEATALRPPAPQPVHQPLPAGDTDPIHRAATESALWAAWAETATIGDLGVEQILADTRATAADYLVGDPAALFAQTRQQRDRVFTLLETPQHPRQSRDLYMAAGYLCALLAWMSSDLGHLRDAETQSRTAWLCAEVADHHTLRAWVLSTRSKIALWDGRIRDAVTHARRGASYATTGTVGVLLACQEADAWSQIGAVDEARAALLRAHEAPGDNGADDVGGLFACNDYRRVNYATAVDVRTGRPAAALATAQYAMAHHPATSYGTAAQLHIALAQAHVAMDEPEGAADALVPVLALPADHRLTPVTTRLRDFSRDLARTQTGGTTGVRLRSDIDSWCRDSAAHALSSGPTPG
jgi:transcriptional regulator with XRE-family HTH domain